MKDEDRFRKEATAEAKAQRKLGRDLWSSERARLVKKSGAGFLRYTDKPSLSQVATVVDKCLDAGCVWTDIEPAIKAAAANPNAKPWTIFDFAMTEMSARQNAHAHDQAPRVPPKTTVYPGFRPVGSAAAELVARLRPHGEA